MSTTSLWKAQLSLGARIRLDGIPSVKKCFISSVRRVDFGGVANEIKKLRTVPGWWRKKSLTIKKRRRKLLKVH